MEGGDEASVWEPPTSPELILLNLETAFEQGIFNDYRRALTEDFAFHPDETDSFAVEVERPGENTWADWDRDVETETAESIRGGVDSVDVAFTLLAEEGDADDRLRKEDYSLVLYLPGETKTYAGEAWIRVRQVSGEWFIYEWTDIASSPSHESWGLLRGRNRL
jgi:hypothetical protein